MRLFRRKTFVAVTANEAGGVWLCGCLHDPAASFRGSATQRAHNTKCK